METLLQLVQVHCANDVGVVTLNNPKKLNALSKELIDHLCDAFEFLQGQEARAVILRAPAGSKVFSAGHDVRELPTNGRDPLTYNDPLRRIIRAIERSTVPVLAMVEGSVWGGACELVMSCDLAVAAEGATFAMTPARLGVPYDIAGVLNFMRSVPLPVVKEMLFTAQAIPAERALKVGLVNCVVPADRLEEVTDQLAAQITRNSPLVIGLLKEQLRVLSGAAPLNPEMFERIQALRRKIYDSADYQEGIRAFFEKRAPHFEGR